MQTKFNQNGRILFEGLSPLTGEKIVCIITGLKTSTSNEKTGDMLQTWILLQDEKPNEAHKNGLNRGVCGDCPHAGYNNGSCYVKWFQAPLQVWKSYKAGRYDYFNNSDLKTHFIGIFGGIIWCIGMSLSLLSSEKAGYPISYGLGQGATMIAAAWGVFIWKEFENASKKINILLLLMFLFFILGLFLIIISRFN